MSALPKAVAQAAAVTACTRAVVVQAVLLQRLLIKLSSSPPAPVIDDAAGWLCKPLPSTRAASGPVTESIPACDENSPALKVTPGNMAETRVGLLTISLQYWMASCAMPTCCAEEKLSSVGIAGSCCCTAW